jgi:thiol-disulfide isomerase/thioredoxin
MMPGKLSLWQLLVVLLAGLTSLPHTGWAAPRALTLDAWPPLQASLKDKPAIVHFWGVTCAICMAELPEWGAFAARHPDLRIVFVNWDRQPDSARIAATLGKAKLGDIESWARAETFEEKLRFAIDREWMGEMPYTRLIAADGAVTSFSGAADFGRLAAWLGTKRYEP